MMIRLLLALLLAASPALAQPAVPGVTAATVAGTYAPIAAPALTGLGTITDPSGSTGNEVQFVTRNTGSGTGMGGIGFTSGPETPNPKAGIGLIRGAANGVGRVGIFVSNNSATTAAFLPADERISFFPAGRVGIGSTTDDGTNQLQVAGTTATTDLNVAGTGAIAGAWTAYTPTVSAGGGTITTSSATGRYRKIGRTVFVSGSISITANGTGASDVRATLPVATVAGVNSFIPGREQATTGKGVSGAVFAGTNLMAFTYTADNTYPGSNTMVIVFSGTYESAS